MNKIEFDESIKLKCKKCGRENCDLYDGECYVCHFIGDDPDLLELPIPDKILFVGKIAKFGKGRKIIEIPKNQRDLVGFNIKYYILLTPMEAKE